MGAGIRAGARVSYKPSRPPQNPLPVAPLGRSLSTMKLLARLGIPVALVALSANTGCSKDDGDTAWRGAIDGVLGG